MYLFSYNDLEELAKKNRSKFKTGSPFPNLVIDDFLPLEVANTLANEFPKSSEDFWIKHGSGSKKDEKNDPGTKVASFDER